MIPMHRISHRMLGRRAALRGMLGGAAVTVGLPFLDCFLNTNATALADGQKLPVCFGTWFWGLGLNPGRWEPPMTGKFTFVIRSSGRKVLAICTAVSSSCATYSMDPAQRNS